MRKKRKKYHRVCFVCEKQVESRLFKEGNITCQKCMRVTSSFEQKPLAREIDNYWTLKKYYEKKRMKTKLPKVGLWYYKGKPMTKADLRDYLNR